MSATISCRFVCVEDHDEQAMHWYLNRIGTEFPGSLNNAHFNLELREVRALQRQFDDGSGLSCTAERRGTRLHSNRIFLGAACVAAAVCGSASVAAETREPDSYACVVPLKIDGIRLDAASVIVPVDAAKALFAAASGLFLYEPDKGTATPVPGGDSSVTGRLGTDLRVAGAVLLGAEKGLFRYDTATGDLQRVAASPPGAVTSLIDLKDGGVLVHIAPGSPFGLGTFYRFDMKSEKWSASVPVPLPPISRRGQPFGLPGGGVILAVSWMNRVSALLYDASSSRFVPAWPDVLGDTVRVVPGSDDEVLFAAEKGLFRYNPDSKKPELIRARQTQDRWQLIPPDFGSAGSLVVKDERQAWRYDSGSKKLEPLGDAKTGLPVKAISLPGGDVLFLNERGEWFRSDRGQGTILQLTESAPAVGSVVALPNGGVLISQPGRGPQRYDLRSRKFFPAGSDAVPWARPVALRDGLLIGGLLAVPAKPLSQANVIPISDFKDWQPGKGERTIRFKLEHPCAPVGGAIGLTAVASHAGVVGEAAPVQQAGDSADLATSVELNTAGPWTIQVKQGDVAIGNSINFTLADLGFWERWGKMLKLIGAVGSVVYVVAFLSVLGLAHRSARWSRVLMDSVWAKWLTWPFFLLRHFPAAQRWVLEPFFQSVRTELQKKSPPAYLDPPAAGPDGKVLVASELLPALAHQPRLWLQGKSGMGKSAVYSAWERAYFAGDDCTTLARAAAKYGFILVTVPVRHYATVAPPEPKRPESWLEEVILRRLVEFDIALEDPSIVKAMLRAGHIAIALDGTNEADRNDAIAAFARAYRMVRIIATSQLGVTEGWEVWRLPTDISAQRSGLLRLPDWLGEEKGALLDQRLTTIPAQVITSGYDLRLVADLARDNPLQTKLPDGRVALYRAVLDKAVMPDGERIDLAPLRKLALALIVSGRREMSESEVAELGTGVADALTHERSMRITRRAGKNWEFRHDQMRAYLAAAALVEDSLTRQQLIDQTAEGRMFRLRRDDQEALWGFVAALLPDEDVEALWVFAQEDPEDRGLLQSALQREADKRALHLARPSQGKPG